MYALWVSLERSGTTIKQEKTYMEKGMFYNKKNNNMHIVSRLLNDKNMPKMYIMDP